MLYGTLPVIERVSGFAQLRLTLSEGTNTRSSLPEALKPPIIAALWAAMRIPLLVITARQEGARRLLEQISAYAGGQAPVHLLPEPDFLPYERLEPDLSTVQQRLQVLGDLAFDGAPLIVASAYAVAARTIAPQELRKSTMVLKRGEQVDLMGLLRCWEGLGYRMEPAVEFPGTMAHRGGIVDIFPLAAEYPVRLELLGTTVESLRRFDPASQRSLDGVPHTSIGPAMEVLARGRTGLLERLDQRGMTEEAKARLSQEIATLVEGGWFQDMMFYGPLVNGGSALDYLGERSILVVDEPVLVEQALDDVGAQAKEAREQLLARSELPRNYPGFSLTSTEFQRLIKDSLRTFQMDSLTLHGRRPGQGSDLELGISSGMPPVYGGRLQVLLEDLSRMLREGQRVILTSQQAPRLAALLREGGIPFTSQDVLEKTPQVPSISLVHGSVSEGWTVPSEKTVLLSDGELFGLAKQRRPLRRRTTHSRHSFISELAGGDYVVHIDHGVGRFAGTEVRRVDDREREYLVLEYAEGDRLLVPTEHIDRVGPYVGSGDHPPAVTRLGTQEWQRTKNRAKASTAQVAKELLAIYSVRETATGHRFGEDTPWQQDMESAFPYVETPDQLRTIDEVKDDMQAPKPMDRIVAGDVGYGKTEVALRAAFKAVMEGYQVAVLVPTTVLAQQHFNTFRQRMGPFPVRVAMLSRFLTAREQEGVVADLAVGQVDICIGTHRLIQKDIRFKNLGLVIVDEEQRFGVGHKERLKEMRREVDVLSLSATPIPRTLYMALAGVRDMSVMDTPPEERLPIKTYVAQFDDRLVREAILRELGRGGQVFFVHNRIHNIGVMAERLQTLVPEATILVGHGQMPEEQLERVMLEFAEGKADVLLCTTIIESGLDIPNTNTLIINDADQMGLAQLYQLRGRVGRSANRAYAYLLYSADRALTETAERRLKTILSATELGAGFKIAMKDLEIRGAGNLLGTEQTGHISAVGLDLYVRLLSEAVEELKAGMNGVEAPVQPRRPTPNIELPLPAHLPDSYVSDLPTRLSLYSRMVRLSGPNEVNAMADELKDRFGPWPEPVENLLFMLKVKQLALKAGVLSIQHQTGELVLVGDETTWRSLLGVRGPYGEGVRIGHTRVRLDIRKLGNRWRGILQSMLAKAGERADLVVSGGGRR